MPEAPHLTKLTGDYQCLHEFIPATRAKVDSNIWGYLIGATESETTLRRNRAALDAIACGRAAARCVEGGCEHTSSA